MRPLATSDNSPWLVLGAVAVAGLVGAGVSLFSDRLGTLFLATLLIGGALPAVAAGRLGFTSLVGLGRQLRWWHCLWLLLFLSSLVFRVRTFSAVNDNPYDFWALYRAGLVGAVALMLLGQASLGRMQFLPSLFRGLIGLLAAYALMGVLSTFWSVHRSWTLYKSLEYLVDVGLVGAMLSLVRSPREYKSLFNWTWVLLWALVASVWLGAALLPGAVTRGVGTLGIQIQGVLPAVAANGVGELGAVLGAVSLVRFLRQKQNRHLHAVLFLVATLTLLFAQSRSPLTGFLLAVPLALFISRRSGVVLLFCLTLPSVLLLTGADDLLWRYFLRDQGQGLFLTLSGRTDWWDLALASFQARPLIGLGAYAGTQFAVMSQVSSEISSIHSTWVQALVDTGILGLGLLVLVIGGTWIHALRILRRLDRASIEHQLLTEAVAVLAVITVRSVFTSAFIWHPSLPFLVVLGYVEYLRRQPGPARGTSP